MEKNCVDKTRDRDTSSVHHSSRSYRCECEGSRRQGGSVAGSHGVGEREGVRGDERARRSATGKRRSTEENRHERSQRLAHQHSQQDRPRHHARSRRERPDRYEERENRERRMAGEKRERDRRDSYRGNSQRTRNDNHSLDKEDRKQHRWSSERRKAWNDDVVIRSPLSRLDDHEYPSLSSDDQSAHTPSRLPRKYRKVSESSTDWAAQVEEYEEKEAQAKRDLSQYRRRLELWSGSGSSEDQDQDCSAKPTTREPAKLETDPDVLIRRQKQIDYGKNTAAYDNYTSTIKRKQRVKGKHPFTPNKFQLTSRRSWDKQVKLWRIKLHDFDPPELLRSNTEKAKQSLMYDDTSSQASSDLDVLKPLTETESELMNTSVTSSISDCYLASDESSRRSTPVTELEAMATQASTADSEGVWMEMEEEEEDGENTLTGFPEAGNENTLTGFPEAGNENATTGFLEAGNENAATGFPDGGYVEEQHPPSSSLCIKIPTPSVTPAEPNGYPSSPPLNTNDLVAALQRVVVTQGHTVFDYDHHSSKPIAVTSTCSPGNNNFSGAEALRKANPACRPAPADHCRDQKCAPNILDGFNLDDCFLKDDEFVAELV